MYLAPPPGPWNLPHAPDMRRLRLTGNFTMLKYVLHRTPLELERRLGFHPGRLGAGGWLIALAPGEVMRACDFRLDASTRWSGGLLPPPPADDSSEAARQAQRRRIEDIVGERLGPDSDKAAQRQEIDRLRTLVAAFFAKDWRNTPAKVIPAQPHTAGMRYPDAHALAPNIRSGVPQFTVIQPLGLRAAIAMPIRASRPLA